MEIAYDRLYNRTAAFLNNSFAPVFSGVSRLPRSNKRAVLKRISTQSDSADLVQRLLKTCPDLGKPPRIVGIDLTGSEKRATGWALLEGGRVTTKSLRADGELIRETLAANADLVSIDSPLSLPEGHGRANVPIYRKCELALKRMGSTTAPLHRAMAYRPFASHPATNSPPPWCAPLPRIPLH
jgi:hypothetical protein